MTNNVDITIRAVDKTGGVLTGIMGAFTGLNQGLELARKGFQALDDIYKATVKDTVDYTTAVIDMSRVLGISTEDTSKLIQASDDLFISQEKLNVALLAASRQGIDVSISGLKSLSEEYLSLGEGSERAQFLMKTFGRSGSDMGKLMEIGASGIEKMSSAIQDNLIVTKQGAANVIAYKQALDQLIDSWTGIKTEVGNFVIPVLTDVMNKLQYNTEWNRKLREETERLGIVWRGSVGMLKDGTYITAEYIDQLMEGDTVLQAWSDRLNGLADEYYRLHPEIKRVTDDFIDLASSMMNVAGMQSSYEASIGDLNEQLEQTKIDMLAAGSTKFLSEKDAKKVEGYRKALTSVWLQIKEITDLQEVDLSDAMGMTGGELVDAGFTEQQIKDIADLRMELGYFEGELTSLGTVAYVKQSQLDDLDGLEQKFADIEAQIADVKAAHELATKQIVYDNLMAGLSADGLTSGEFAMAQEYAVGLGLITQNDADLAIALQGIAEAIPTQTGLLGEFNTAVALGDEYIIALNEHILGLTSEKYIDIYIRTHGVPPTGPTSPQMPNHFSDEWIDPNERAGGGPVWGNTPYLVGEKGPEMFVPDKSGTIIPNKQLGGNSVVFYGDAYLEIKEDLKDDILSQLRLTI